MCIRKLEHLRPCSDRSATICRASPYIKHILSHSYLPGPVVTIFEIPPNTFRREVGVLGGYTYHRPGAHRPGAHRACMLQDKPRTIQMGKIPDGGADAAIGMMDVHRVAVSATYHWQDDIPSSGHQKPPVRFVAALEAMLDRKPQAYLQLLPCLRLASPCMGRS